MVSWIDGLGQSDHVNSVHFQQSPNLKLTREKYALYVFTKFDNWDVFSVARRSLPKIATF